MINYIAYVFDTAWFNLVWYKWHLGSDMNVFESCGWKSYRKACKKLRS